MKIKINGLLIFIILNSFRLYSQNFSNGFNFNLPWNDSTSQYFLPQFPPKNITEFIGINSSGNFTAGENQIRFWGTNLVSDGAFPDPYKAPAIAGRLRKMGFNLIRFHHMDNPWSSRSLFADGVNTLSLNPFYLDYFEYLVSALKSNNIYIDVNLNVSRTFKLNDGVSNADSIPDYGKGVTLFDPYLIQLQKDYALQLLTHINPYAGLALVDDPVMAIVEIVNENSLYRMWYENTLKTFGDGGKLIWRHNRMLDSLWNKYILNKYASTQNLALSWNNGANQNSASNLIKNGDFESVNALSNWQLELHETALATQAKDFNNPRTGNFSAKINVTNVTGTDWHIQWKQTNLKLVKDSLYSIKFAARADSNKSINVTIMRDDDPYTYYAGRDFNLTSEWKTFTFSFKVNESISTGRLSFSFKNTTGNYWFDDIKLNISANTGLMEGESIENSTIRRIDYSDAVRFTNARVKDMSAFYIKLQDDFFAEMKSYMKNTLKVKVPIEGTNWNVGPGDLITQSKMDFIDNHSYWDHPSFPNVPWSSTDWFINNQPLVTSTSGYSPADLFAGVPFAGKPFTISEINFCFPNRYQTEGLIFITAYSAFNNTDAIMWFDYNGSNDWSTDMVNSYFDIHRNTAMMALMPSCAYAFRNGFISKSNGNIKLNYTEDQVELLPKNTAGDWSGPNLFSKRQSLLNDIKTESFNSSIPFNFSSLQQEPVSPYKSNTSEILWDTKGLISVNAKKFIGVSGFLDNFKNTEIGPVKIKEADGFGTFTWTTLSGDSNTSASKSLITITTAVQNSGMIWDGTNTIHNNWGKAPTQMKPLIITLGLTIYADSIIVTPLDNFGVEKINQRKTFYPKSVNNFEVTFNQNTSRTLWYGLEKFGAGHPTLIEKIKSNHLEFQVEQNFPNPFNNSTTIKYSLAKESNLKIIIYDELGKKIKTLFDDNHKEGTYQVMWSGKNDSGLDVSSGIYFISFSAGNYSSAKKILLLK
jgi:hypothetical protein